jgi:drug/metabolite transporter (DMT)-like permease
VSARAWAGFAAMSLIWGVPYLFIKVAVDDGVPPVFVAWARIALAAAVLVPLAIRSGALRTVRGNWRWVLAYAVLEIAIPFPLIAVAEQHVDSGLTAIVIAAVPLFVALLALRFDHEERATGVRLVGLVIGLAGVVALVGIDVAGSSAELLSAGALLVAALGYAAGPMILKQRLGDVATVATMSASLVIAGIVLAPLAVVDAPTEMPSAQAWAAIAVLGLVCTAAAFMIFGPLIAEIGPGRALVITYINPVVAVALGVVVLDERPGPGAIAGLALILAGSWLATTGRAGWVRRVLRAPAGA